MIGMGVVENPAAGLDGHGLVDRCHDPILSDDVLRQGRAARRRWGSILQARVRWLAVARFRRKRADRKRIDPRMVIDVKIRSTRFIDVQNLVVSPSVRSRNL